MPKDKYMPPRLPRCFLRWYCRPELVDEVEGDLAELFDRRISEQGLWKARLLYCLNVLMFLHPVYIRKRKNTYSNNTAMFRNHITVAWRNLASKKFYALTNILGLTLGISCCLLIFRYVAFELSFDDFNQNKEQLFRINAKTIQSGDDPHTSTATGWAMGPALEGEVSGIVNTVRLHPDYDDATVSVSDKPNVAFAEKKIFYTDPSFFQMFTYPLVEGNANEVLSSPGTVAISASTARKYFGDEPALGKDLQVNGWIGGTYRVNGIFEDVPANSHLQFDILLPMNDLLTKSAFSDPTTGWNWTNFITYVQLHDKARRNEVEKSMTYIYASANRETWKQNNTKGELSLQPLSDVYLNDDLSAPRTETGSYRSVYFFSIVGLVILLIALVNYINLTTARAMDRAREVGVRKVVGARREQLLGQFLVESALIVLIAFLLALFLTDVGTLWLNRLAEMNIDTPLWTNVEFWTGFVVLAIFTILIAGVYPAITLSSFHPAKVLKGKANRSGSSGRLRKGLVIIQFAASISLLIGITVVYTQLNYMRDREIGIELSQVMTISAPKVLPSDTDPLSARNTFTQEIRKLAAIEQVATSSKVPGRGFNFHTDNIRQAGYDPSFNIGGYINWIDSSFLSLYELELEAQNAETLQASAEGAEYLHLLVNETSMEALGFSDAQQAINQEVDLAGNPSLVVGVLKDFSWSSAHRERENMFFILNEGNEQISVKVNTANLPETVAAVEDTYKNLFPGNPFLYAFADETFAAQYKQDEQFASLVGIFTLLAVFIACIGLFGLASFTAEQRTKEIGVRKVLGASVQSIVQLLAQNFMLMIAIAFLLAMPLAWFVMEAWLQDFAYRIELQWWMFALAGLAATAIALFTISFQSIKAAVANPVDSLRSE